MLAEMHEHPVRINHMRFEEYYVFFFLSEFEKQSLHMYVRQQRGIKSPYELQLVLGFTKETAMLVAAVCSFETEFKQYNIQEKAQRGKHSFTAYYAGNLVNKEIYLNEFSYPGKPLKTVYRYRFQSHNSLFWGVTFANDMGEAQQKGFLSHTFDYYSAYIQIQDRKKTLSNIVIGDYRVTIGQGLIMQQGGFYAKSMSAPSIVSAPVLRRHTSSNEYNFNRGAGVSITHKNITLTPFMSYKKTDGFYKDSGTGLPFQIYSSGLRRTERELKYKNMLSHSIVGININKNLPKLKLGIAALEHTFKDSVNKAKICNVSFHYNYTTQNTIFFGESAIDKNTKKAHLHGVKHSISPLIESAVIIRHYAKNYQSYMSHAFSEQSNIDNEKGFFLYYKMQFMGNYILSISHDRYAHIEAPENLQKMKGNETYASISYTKFKAFNIELRTSFEEKNRTYKHNQTYSNEHTRNNIYKNSFRFIYYYKNIEYRSFYMVSHALQNRKIYIGTYFAQDFIYKTNKKLHIHLRGAVFNAPYHTRLYIYEPSVDYAFTTPQIIYTGKQAILRITYAASPKLRLQFHSKQHFYSPNSNLPAYYNMYGKNKKLQLAGTVRYTF